MKELTIWNLRLTIDAYGAEPVEEAVNVVHAINSLLSRMGGDPVLSVESGTFEDIRAEYTEVREEEG